MSFTSCIRIWLACTALLVAIVLLPTLAAADALNECNINVEHVSFAAIVKPGGLQLVFFEGAPYLECNDLVIDDFKFPVGFQAAFVAKDKGDTIMLLNLNNGPGGNPAANVCLWSDNEEGTNGVCQIPRGLKPTPSDEVLDTGSLKGPGGVEWHVVLYSDPEAGPCTAPTGLSLSDCGVLARSPEPGTLGLLAVGLPGLAWYARRRLCGRHT